METIQSQEFYLKSTGTCYVSLLRKDMAQVLFLIVREASRLASTLAPFLLRLWRITPAHGFNIHIQKKW